MRVHPLPILSAALLLAVAVAAPTPPSEAHNNPSFKEELLHTLEVSDQPLAADGAAHTEPFTLAPPKGSVELVWRMDGTAGGGGGPITFSLAQDGEVVAEGLKDGAVSKLQKGDGFTIVDVAGAQAPFTVQVYANVLDRSGGGAATPQG